MSQYVATRPVHYLADEASGPDSIGTAVAARLLPWAIGFLAVAWLYKRVTGKKII